MFRFAICMQNMLQIETRQSLRFPSSPQGWRCFMGGPSSLRSRLYYCGIFLGSTVTGHPDNVPDSWFKSLLQSKECLFLLINGLLQLLRLITKLHANIFARTLISILKLTKHVWNSAVKTVDINIKILKHLEESTTLVSDYNTPPPEDLFMLWVWRKGWTF